MKPEDMTNQELLQLDGEAFKSELGRRLRRRIERYDRISEWCDDNLPAREQRN